MIRRLSAEIVRRWNAPKITTLFAPAKPCQRRGGKKCRKYYQSDSSPCHQQEWIWGIYIHSGPRWTDRSWASLGTSMLQSSLLNDRRKGNLRSSCFVVPSSLRKPKPEVTLESSHREKIENTHLYSEDETQALPKAWPIWWRSELCYSSHLAICLEETPRPGEIACACRQHENGCISKEKNMGPTHIPLAAELRLQHRLAIFWGVSMRECNLG